MARPDCPELARLEAELENTLGNLAQASTLLLELFRAREHERWRSLDKELELTLGEKERSIGALRQHLRDHKCLGDNPYDSQPVNPRRK
jgi:hypothetical protein